MVAFLSEPAESNGFEQIMDFLNAQPIRYALTVNPTIYISCIEQFWSADMVKTINGEVQLHAILDGKKIIISEASVRRDLKLEDEECIDYLPNSAIFKQLALMGYEKISQKLSFYKPFFSPQWKFLIHTILQCISSKTTTWNEFSSTMASDIICLTTNQKFNFSKFLFEGMIRNMDNVSGKFLMYPRRVGKGFSGRVTPLFPIMVVQHQLQIGEGSTNPTDPHHTPTIIQPSTQPQKTQKPKNPKRKDTQVPQPSDPSDNVVDEAVYKELGDSLVRAATTASSLEAEQDSGNITKTRSKATPNESSSLGTTSCGGLRCQETIGDTVAQTRFENVSKLSNDSLLTRVLDLEKTKTIQANEIASFKRRVMKLEKKRSLRTYKLKRLYKVGLSARVESSGNEENLGEDASKQGRRINVIDADEDINLVNVQDDADNEMFDVNVLNDEEVFVAGQNENVVEEVVNAAQDSTAATTITITTEEITLAQALEALKTLKPKVKVIIFQEPGKSTTTTTISSQQSQDKGKGIMIEEPVKPIKKKVQIMLDEEVALKLQAQEQEKLSVEEKAKLFQQLLEQRRKHFDAKSAEENRNKPPTQAQQRKIMCTYLKNMEGKKLKDLKNKSFNSIQKMVDIAFKRVNTFVDFRTDLVEGSSKRAGEELEQESTKKQKVDEDKDTAKLQSLMEFIPDEEEVAIDAVPLATKSTKIVDWKIHKEGKKSYYQIVRADEKSQMYMIFSQMLKSFDREDLEDLYKLVKARYGSTRLVESMDYLLWNDLKTMFEPNVKDAIWRNQQEYKVLEWKLYVEQEALGRIVGIKSLLNAASITAAHIRVNAA
ncbi:hypothetical protein Tco_0381793 [Tanacetum coccineum]